MKMDRLAFDSMMNWYKDPLRKPLIIWGARQVGKTYLIKELFLPEFKNGLYIDLKKDDDARSFFSTTSDPEKYLKYIEARYGIIITPETPLIFDEVQLCPNVLSSLKYFCQDRRELPVIATGSMVRLALRHDDDPDFLFPVGKVDEIDLFPISFREYLMAANPSLLTTICDSYASGRVMERYEHDMAMDALYEYLTIGGMPEALEVFLSTGSYVNAGKVVRSVYSNYLSDMDTYNVSPETILKTMNVYKSIYSQLNKANRNYKISAVEKNKSNRDYFNAYQWLELARVVYRSKALSGKVPMPIPNDDSGLFRLYLADPGIFTYQSGLPQSDFFVREKRNTLSGIFYENYVACELVSKGIPLRYWTGKSSHEFEFVVQIGNEAVPIDVKKSGGKMNSLDSFREHNRKALAVKVSSDNYGYDENTDVLTIPLYEAFLLAEDIAAGNDPVHKRR